MGAVLLRMIRTDKISRRYVRLAVAGSLAAAGAGAVLGWPLWLLVSVGLALWTPAFTMEVAWTREHYGWLALFYALAVLQGAHLVEHIVQMVQIHVLHLVGPAARGVFGNLDVEWVHFVWNTLVFVAVGLLVWRFPRNPALWITAALAAWHQAEHVYILSVYVSTGIAGDPGLLARGGVLSSGVARPNLHFLYNLIETGLLFGAFGRQLHRASSA